MVAVIMHVFFPLVSTLLHTSLIALWTVSVYGQMGPDYADPLYPSPVAWYIYRSCDAAGGRYRAVRSCQLARASFAVSVLMLAILLAHLGHALYAMWPTDFDRLSRKQQRRYLSKNNEDDSDDDDDDDDDTSNSDASDAKARAQKWEMSSFSASGGAGPGTGGRTPASPGFPPRSPAFQQQQQQPFTPRTAAFHELDRKLPLRQQYG